MEEKSFNRDVTEFDVGFLLRLAVPLRHKAIQKVMKNEIFIFVAYLANCHLCYNPLNMHSRATKHD